MRVILIHNPNAGDDSQPDRGDLLDLIRDAGHDVSDHSSKDENLSALIEASPDLIAIAGGDGTVAKVVKLVLGRGIPLAVLPTGTANNISRTLGVADMPMKKQIAAWPKARKLPFNVGLASGPWGTRYFVESVGVGLLAWTIPHAETSAKLANLDDAGAKVAYARKMLRDRLKARPALALKATLDGKNLSGNYVLFEAMNMRFIGPNLELAPEAKPGDGQLDVVLVSEAERDALHEHLAAVTKAGVALSICHRTGADICASRGPDSSSISTTKSGPATTSSPPGRRRSM